MNPSGKTIAPWTVEQVEALNWFQTDSGWHEFTCGTEGCLTHGSRTTLKATPNGWVCPQCDYRQDWAHEFMIEIGLTRTTARSQLEGKDGES